MRAIRDQRRKEIEERQQQLEEEISQAEKLLHETEEEIDQDIREEHEERLEELREERETLEGIIEEEGVEERGEGQAQQESRLYHGRETGYQNQERLEYHVGGGARMRPGENIHFNRTETSMRDMYRRSESGGNQNYTQSGDQPRGTRMSDMYSQQERDRPGMQADYKTSEQTRGGSNLSTNILREMYRH